MSPFAPTPSSSPASPPSSKDGRCRGFITVEALFGILALLALTSLAVYGWSVGMEALKKRAVASQLQDVAEAAKIYARSQGLVSSLTAGGAATSVTVQNLITAGAMAPGFGSNLTNAWGQSYAIYYYVPALAAGAPDTARRLVVLVLTQGGEAMDQLAQSAATLVGSAGGVVLNKKATPGDPDAWVLRGAGQGYELPLATAPQNIPSPGAGHLGLYASLNDAALGTDVLYRVEVPGQPELNQMNVDLDMRGNSINDVKSLRFNATAVAQTDLATICTPTAIEPNTEGKVFFYTGDGTTGTADTAQDGLYACRNGSPYQIGDAGNSRLIRAAQFVNNGASINKPTCNNATEVPFISVSPATIPSLPILPLGTTVRTYYEDNGTSWKVLMGVLDTSTSTTTLLTGGSISVITSCAPKP